jgi:malate dehydrogenase (oxaloacetate-decarboxylating)
MVDPRDKNLLPIKTNLRGEDPFEIARGRIGRALTLLGSALLNNPRLNKGAGFTREERQVFNLEGFLPYDVHSLEKQARRAWNQLLKVSRLLPDQGES